MNNYILTVVIPTYNTEEYLSRCVTSLLDPQINGKVQIIVVNDGSKDNSLKEAIRLAQNRPYIQVIDKPNAGHGSTINKGVELAQGKYFRVLDSDDWFNTPHFVKFVNQLDNLQSDLIVTWGYIEKVYEKKQLPYHMFDDNKHIIYNIEYNINTFDFKNKYVVMALMTYKTEILKKNYRPLLENTFYVDNEFLLYPMINVKSITFLDLYIYHYFIGRPEQSMSDSVLERNIDHIKRVALTTAQFSDQINPEDPFYNYALNIVKRTALEYYTNSLCRFLNKRIMVYNKLESFDKELKKKSPKIYKSLLKHKSIGLYRLAPLPVVIVAPFIYKLLKFLKLK